MVAVCMPAEQLATSSPKLAQSFGSCICDLGLKVQTRAS